MSRHPLVTIGVGVFLAGALALVLLIGDTPSPTGTTAIHVSDGDSVIRAHGLLPEFDLDALVYGDNIVIIGTIDSIIGSDWNQEVTHGPMIHTNVVVSVDHYVAGKLPYSQLAVRVPGGRIGKEVMVMDVAPVFTVREHVLLFLYSPPYKMQPVPDRFSSDSYFMIANYGKLELNGDLAVCGQSGRTFSLERLVDQILWARGEI